MALQQDIKYNGITVSNAYIKIDFLKGTKSQQNILTRFYANKNQADEGNYIDERHDIVPVSCDETAGNFIKQGYEWLKANVFTDAINI